MKFGRFGWSYFVLRLGLGLTFLYIGIDIFRNKNNWIGFLPQSLPGGMSPDTAILIGGGVDVLLGVALIIGYWPRLTAWLSTFHLVGIIIVNSLDAVIARDIGLAGSALALAFWPHGQTTWWRPKWMRRRRKSHSDED